MTTTMPVHIYNQGLNFPPKMLWLPDAVTDQTPCKRKEHRVNLQPSQLLSIPQAG